jgi:tetratricopeptide (TPR) repeat protein
MNKRNFTELAMEREPIQKNRVSPKNEKSRNNFLLHFNIKKWLLFLLICCNITLLQAQTNNTEEMRKYIRRAQTAYNAGELNDALKEYKAAQALVPDYPELCKAIGDVYEKLGSTADLVAAIASYKRYLQLAPQAADARQIQDKIYDLEYLQEKAEKQDKILDDLSGRWVAINNVQIPKEDTTAGTFSWLADYVFDIEEIAQAGKHTGVYRVTVQPAGCRFYRESIIEKTVTIVPAKDNSFTFVFADAQVYTPNPAKSDALRIFGNTIGAATGKSWMGELANTAANAYQTSDLPSNTQTAYTFAIKYDEGKLVGLVNIVQKFANPNIQQTTQNKLEKVVFVKQDEDFYAECKKVFGNAPDILTVRPGATFSYNDKNGVKVKRREVYEKILLVDADLAKRYKKVSNKEKNCFVSAMIGAGALGGGLGLVLSSSDDVDVFGVGVIALFAGALITTPSMIIGIRAGKTRMALVEQYNNQIRKSSKPKFVSELRFGITPSGGIGLTLNF